MARWDVWDGTEKTVTIAPQAPGLAEPAVLATMTVEEAKALAWGILASLQVQPSGWAFCAYCGSPAACWGQGEGHGPVVYACDVCCGHGNEDSWCHAISRDCGERTGSEGE